MHIEVYDEASTHIGSLCMSYTVGVKPKITFHFNGHANKGISIHYFINYVHNNNHFLLCKALTLHFTIGRLQKPDSAKIHQRHHMMVPLLYTLRGNC